MHAADQPQSWEVAVGAPMDLNFAAFVWDKSAPTERPHLDAAWRGWWTSLVENRREHAEGRIGVTDDIEPPDFDSLAPTLRAACHRTWANFHSWWAPSDGIGRAQLLVQAGAVDITQLMRAIERERDTTAHSFSVVVDVVESEQARSGVHGKNYALITAAVWRDPAAAERLLRSLLIPLI